MKSVKKILAGLIALLLLLPPVSVFVSAEVGGAEEPELVEAEILSVRGGAGGIISMTFDDGYYETATIVDELAKQYGLTASLMMTSHSISQRDNRESATLQTWQEFFKNSPLEPQSHTKNHYNMTSDEYQDEAIFYAEFAEWQQTLEEYFPAYDVITLAMPHGAMSSAAVEYASDYYFAIRSTQYGVQTLDPDFSTNVGSWKCLYSPVVRIQGGDEAAQLEYIKHCIDMNANGWYAPIIHRVGTHENAEMSYELTEAMFEYIASLQAAGKVWVTTFSEATKYLRERQNATAHYYTSGDRIYVVSTLSEYTEDGLYLDPEIFDTPLTVKLEIPASYDKVYYTVRGVEYQGKIIEEGGKRYTLVDVIPDGKAIELRPEYSHEMGEYTKCDEERHQKVCVDCGFIIYQEHIPDEGVVTTPPEHMSEGVRTHTCTVCGEDSESVIEKTPEHTFDCKSTKGKYLVSIQSCTEGRKYRYSCECGEAGEETFYSTEPLGHKGTWRVIREATEDEDGRERRRCTECGVTEERARGFEPSGPSGTEGGTTDAPGNTSQGESDNTSPDANAPSTQPPSGDVADDADDGTVVIVAVAVGSAVVLGGGAFVFVRIKRKKKGA